MSLAKTCASSALFASRHLVEDALTDVIVVVGVDEIVTADVVCSDVTFAAVTAGFAIVGDATAASAIVGEATAGFAVGLVVLAATEAGVLPAFFAALGS